MNFRARRILISCLLASALLLVSASSAGPAPFVNGTWPMYQNGAAHNAVVPFANLRARWSASTGGRLNGGLALAGSSLFVGSMDGRAYAFDARTGALRWQQPLGRATMSAPVVIDNLVIFGTGTNEVLSDTVRRVVWGSKAGDAVVALDAMYGWPVWRFRTVGEDMPTAAIVRQHGRDVAIVSNGDDHVYALDAITGTLLWKRDTFGISTMSSLATDGRIVYGLSNLSQSYGDATAHDESLYRLRSRTWAIDVATQRFRFDVPFGNSDCSPTIGGNALFIESEHRLNPAGSTRGEARNFVAALDPATGRLRWQYVSRPGRWSGRGSNEEAIAGLYEAGTYYTSLPYPRQFAAFDAARGAMRWVLETGAPVKMSAVLADGKLFFGDTAGTLYVVDARSGHIEQRRSLRGSFGAAPPLVAGRTLFLAVGKRVVALPLDVAEGATSS